MPSPTIFRDRGEKGLSKIPKHLPEHRLLTLCMMTFLASQSLEACDHLEALGELSTAVHRFNEVIEQMNQKIVELDPHFRAVESKISSIHVPFQMSVFEFVQVCSITANATKVQANKKAGKPENRTLRWL